MERGAVITDKKEKKDKNKRGEAFLKWCGEFNISPVKQSEIVKIVKKQTKPSEVSRHCSNGIQQMSKQNNIYARKSTKPQSERSASTACEHWPTPSSCPRASVTEALLQGEREDDLQLCSQPIAAFSEATRSGALISHPVSACRMEAVSQAWHAENTGTELPLPPLTNWVKFPRWKIRDKKTGAAIPIPLTEQGSHSTERGLTSLSPHLEHWYRIGLLGTGVEGVWKKSTRTESSVHPTSGLTSPGTELGEVQD